MTRIALLVLFPFVIAGTALLSDSLQGGERIVFADQKLSIELPDGWKKSERNQGTTMIGWESQDETTSVFFQKMEVNSGIGMSEILDMIVDNFDENEALKFQKVGQYATGQVNGTEKKFPAIFTTLDASMEASPQNFDLKFYLFVFDTGSAQYFIQASSTKPVWDVREKQIMSLIRSLIARK